MERISNLSDRDLERLLIANLQSGEHDVEELSVFIQDVKTLLAEPPEEAIAAGHLAAMTELAQRLAEGEAEAGPARATSSSDRGRSGHTRSWRKAMRLKLLVAAVGVVVLTAFGGAAYAGVLPAGVQSSVADLAGKVGVTLPVDEGNVDEGDVTGVDDDDQGVVDVHDEGDVDPGDQGDDDKGQKADDDDQGEDDHGDKADDQGNQGDDDDQGDDDQGQQSDDDDQGGDDQGEDDKGQQGDDDDQGDDDHGSQHGDQGDDDQGQQSDDDQGHQSDDDDQESSDSDD
jgi:hypothetical protein